ncbi:MAG: hypothetical protein WKF61_00490 [Luteimonas sp.]
MALRPPVGDLRQIGDVGRATATLVRNARASGRHESFFDALERQGMSLADADERARQIQRIGHIYAGTAAVAFVLIALAPFSSVPLAQFMGALAVMVMSGAKALVAYFRVAQVHDRQLYGFVSWVRGKREEVEAAPERTDLDPTSGPVDATLEELRRIAESRSGEDGR